MATKFNLIIVLGGIFTSPCLTVELIQPEVTLTDQGSDSAPEPADSLSQQVEKYLSAGQHKEAIDFLAPSIVKGEPEAHYLIGKILVRYGTPDVFEDGLKHLRIAAQKLYPGAFFELGGLYTNGRGVSKDLAEAANYYKLAADMGNGEGQFNYGVVLMKGEGIDQDLKAAHHYFSLAAKNARDLHEMTQDAAEYRDYLASILSSEDEINFDTISDLINHVEKEENNT